MSSDKHPTVLSTLNGDFLNAGRPGEAGHGSSRPGRSPLGERAGRIDEPGPGNVVYRDRYHAIYRLGVSLRGVEKEYRVIESGSRAGVLPVRGEAVLLVRQYRLLVDGLSWEIPGGKVEAGETPQAAAARECLEETGVTCRNLRTLTGYHPGMDTFCNPTYLYYADDISEGAAAGGERSETVARAWFRLDEVVDMIRSGLIVDAFTMIGILTYKLRTDTAGRTGAATG